MTRAHIVKQGNDDEKTTREEERRINEDCKTRREAGKYDAKIITGMSKDKLRPRTGQTGAMARGGARTYTTKLASYPSSGSPSLLILLRTNSLVTGTSCTRMSAGAMHWGYDHDLGPLAKPFDTLFSRHMQLAQHDIPGTRPDLYATASSTKPMCCRICLVLHPAKFDHIGAQASDREARGREHAVTNHRAVVVRMRWLAASGSKRLKQHVQDCDAFNVSFTEEMQPRSGTLGDDVGGLLGAGVGVAEASDRTQRYSTGCWDRGRDGGEDVPSRRSVGTSAFHRHRG